MKRDAVPLEGGRRICLVITLGALLTGCALSDERRAFRAASPNTGDDFADQNLASALISAPAPKYSQGPLLPADAPSARNGEAKAAGLRHVIAAESVLVPPHGVSKNQHDGIQIIPSSETASRNRQSPEHLYPAESARQSNDSLLRASVACTASNSCGAEPTVLGRSTAQATGSGDGGTDLEKANQAFANPIAQATLFIVENDTIFLDGDISDKTRVTNVTVIEPLIPVALGDTGWSLVNRPILPIAVSADIPVAGSGGSGSGASPGISFDNKDGLGDFTFFSLLTESANESPIKWGVGPIFRFPTATDDDLGAEKFSVGPAGVALYSSKSFTLGFLSQNLFSVAGEGSRDDVAVSTLQYFAFYNFTPEWGIGTAPIISANWEADYEDRFLVPVGLGVTRSFKIGEIPTRLLLEGQHYVVQRDSFGPEWNVRVALAMFFPPLFD